MPDLFASDARETGRHNGKWTERPPRSERTRKALQEYEALPENWQRLTQGIIGCLIYGALALLAIAALTGLYRAYALVAGG